MARPPRENPTKTSRRSIRFCQRKSATGCAVIVVPGGAFTHRAMDQEGVTFGKWFADRGIAAFVLRYRIQPLYGRSDYLLDGQRSVQFVKAHASEYRISPDRVGMIGFSAGSDLTTMVAYQTFPLKKARRISSSGNPVRLPS